MRFCRTTLDGRLHQKHPVNSLFRADQEENQGTPFDVLMRTLLFRARKTVAAMMHAFDYIHHPQAAQP